MPADVTIFAAQYLVFIEALAAGVTVGLALYRLPRAKVLQWIIAAGITGIVAEVLARVGSAVYNDPRPFAIGHFHPLVSHVADNGFPSDHALLAAFLVVCVLLVRVWVTVPLVATLGVLVDWARVGAGIHHPIDVIGSAVFVALAAGIAVVITRFVLAWISPHLPYEFSQPEPISAGRRSADDSK